MDRSAVILLQTALCLTVLVVETYSNISWPRDVLHRNKRQSGCQADEFRCTSGECIDTFSVCNGTKECADGSDETSTACKQLNVTDPPSTPQEGGCILPQAPEFGDYTAPICELDNRTATCSQVPGTSVPKNWLLSFECNEGYHLKETQDKKLYAVCVHGKWSPKIPVCVPPPPPQDGGCLLPDPPEFGAYSTPICESDNKTAVCRQVPGTPVFRHWVLIFKCNEGYYIKDETVNVFCVNGTWLPGIPVCRKMCSPLVSLSVDVRCSYEGDHTDCRKPMRSGARASGQCLPAYTLIQRPAHREIICKDNGQWTDELFSCQPVCGRRNVQGVNRPLIVHGSPTRFGEFPWHVGLYRRSGFNQWKQICGGTLISPHIVLTAAHCVFSELGYSTLPPESFKVGLGKYFREWIFEEPHAVKADVREILIPPGYSGQATSFTQDIALLDLTYSVQLHASIMPVCIDWKREFIITPGMLGKFSGWGDTEEGIPSDVLLYVDLPYIDYHNCIKDIPQQYRHNVTSDKFCVRFRNGVAVAPEDAGGGLTFAENDLYYLHGIASSTVNTSKLFTTFTNISNVELLSWLNRTKDSLDAAHPESCPSPTFRCDNGACIDGNKRCNGHVDCVDGSDEAAPACSGDTSITPLMAVSVPLKCKNTEFKCMSGQCIDKMSVCDGRVNCADGSDETVSHCSSTSPPSLPQGQGCLVPQPPEFGVHTGVACALNSNNSALCRQTPGTIVPEIWALSFNCNEGYYIKETQDENFYTFCISGKWSPKIPVCRKMCPPLVSLSVAVRCFNREGDMDCSKPMRPGTRAKGECKPSYTQIRPPPYTEIFCKDNGQWSYVLFYCQPVCGKRNKQGINSPLLKGGIRTKYGELPWHVGLYTMTDSYQWKNTCGGSLISPHVVITAAHCVFSEEIKTKLPPEAIKVGLGKYYREWNGDEPHAVQASVREILIPPRYFGQATSFTQDIALLDLKDSVQLHANIMPVCIDWKREFAITPGMLGTLAGWGKTENGTASDVLLHADLPYVDYRHCLYQVPQVFQHYITSDKFCGGFDNGTGAAEGDSGGGLTFVRDNLHYLYGIVSTKVKDANSFITLTNVTNEELFTWVNYAMRVFAEAHPET